MSRLFQIHEDDLADLERLVPMVSDCLNMRHLDNAMRGRLRRVQKILSDVRWNYGPYTNITEIPVNPPPETNGEGPEFVG